MLPAFHRDQASHSSHRISLSRPSSSLRTLRKDATASGGTPTRQKSDSMPSASSGSRQRPIKTARNKIRIRIESRHLSGFSPSLLGDELLKTGSECFALLDQFLDRGLAQSSVHVEGVHRNSIQHWRFRDSLIADPRYLSLLRLLAKSEEPVP